MHEDITIEIQNDGICTYSKLQELQDIFVGNLAHRRLTMPCHVDMNLQFDISRYSLPIPLSEEARQLLRSAAMEEPKSTQENILKALKVRRAWVSQQNNVHDYEMRGILDGILKGICARRRGVEMLPVQGSVVLHGGTSGRWLEGSQAVVQGPRATAVVAPFGAVAETLAATIPKGHAGVRRPAEGTRAAILLCRYYRIIINCFSWVLEIAGQRVKYKAP